MAVLYNCLAFAGGRSDAELEFGYPKMARLVSKYDVLQNMNQHSVIHPIHLKLFSKAVGAKK